MSLYSLNKHLEEQIDLVEGGGRRPVPKDWVEFDPEKGHYWRTVGTQKVMFDKSGRMMTPRKWMGDDERRQGRWNKPITKEQQKQLDAKQAEVDQIMGGKDHGVRVELDKHGKPVVSQDSVQKAIEKDDNVDAEEALVSVKGSSILDMFTTLTAMVDTYSALLLKAGQGLSKVLGKATDDLLGALEMWQK